MKLSVIIVSYNVKFFLEQCLQSVYKSLENIESEVFVVDNNSIDSSVKMVQDKFPQVKLICNKENVGFSRANNQAIRLSQGEYVLLLNPDTVVEHDTFIKSINFMDSTPDCGGLGIKMVDGKGVFLPESKRGLPTPKVAFYKIFGLSKFFPKSKTFGQYHLGYLDNNKTHRVDVLSGAYMMLRRKTLDKVGLLDENFFMYGEDIDLSYRITLGGYNNYYFPDARIIHYKGESTKKSSINYVFVFYNAMIIFAKKHFSKNNAWVFALLINIAVYLRAFLAIAFRFLRKLMLPLIDFLVFYLGALLISNYWAKKLIYPLGGTYPDIFMYLILPTFILIWLFAVYVVGGYEKPIRISKSLLGIILGSIFILVAYSLFPTTLRFSRALILLSGVCGLFSLVIIRLLAHYIGFKGFKFNENQNNRYAIIGNYTEAKRVFDLVRKTVVNPEFIGIISVNDDNGNDIDEDKIGNINSLKDIVSIYKINELIFCSKDIPHQTIINIMTQQFDAKIDYKIAPPESMSIIGSNSIVTANNIYVIDINSIGKSENLRIKRVFDLTTALIMLSVSPIIMFTMSKPMSFVANMFKIIIGRKTFVGYKINDTINKIPLPKIKNGILTPLDAIQITNIDNETINNLNMLYARNYKLFNDLNIVIKGFRKLDRTQLKTHY